MPKPFHPLDVPGCVCFQSLRVFRIKQGGKDYWILGMDLQDALAVVPGGREVFERNVADEMEQRRTGDGVEINDIGPVARQIIGMGGP